MDQNLSRLRWKCRRGMLELDLWLTHYLDQAYLHASLDEKADFDQLLSEADADIWEWLMSVKQPTAPLVRVISKIQQDNNIPVLKSKQ